MFIDLARRGLLIAYIAEEAVLKKEFAFENSFCFLKSFAFEKGRLK